MPLENKHRRLLILSVILLVLVVVVALWGKKGKRGSSPYPQNEPPALSALEPLSSVTSIEGVIKAIAGGAIYVEMPDPVELVSGTANPKKVTRVALATKNTVIIVTDAELPPSLDNSSDATKKYTLADLKIGDRVILQSSNDMRTPESFDVTRIEVIR